MNATLVSWWVVNSAAVMHGVNVKAGEVGVDRAVDFASCDQKVVILGNAAVNL